MDPVTQLFTTAKLTIRFIIFTVICIAIAMLISSVNSCIDIKQENKILKTSITAQKNITKDKDDNIEKAIEKHKIIAIETAKAEKEMMNFKSSPELSSKINCIYENFNNLEYDC